MSRYHFKYFVKRFSCVSLLIIYFASFCKVAFYAMWPLNKIKENL